jgi:hypothetical protein
VDQLPLALAVQISVGVGLADWAVARMALNATKAAQAIWNKRKRGSFLDMMHPLH